jgi:hypothetical protein
VEPKEDWSNIDQEFSRPRKRSSERKAFTIFKGNRCMTDFVEPLPSELWFKRLEMIASGELASVENALRHASHLLLLAPISYRNIVRLTIEEIRFEKLLDLRDLDGAARHLIAHPLALTLSADGERVQATVSCPVLGHPVRVSGDTVASAIVGAWATCLPALRTAMGAEGRRQSLRKYLSAPDLLSWLR